MAHEWHDPDYWVSEPVFVPRSQERDSLEDDGVVLSLLTKKLDLNYAGLLILDAKNMAQLARVDFKTRGTVTPTVHGLFDVNRSPDVEIFS